MTTLADLVPDPQNARRHTPRNVGLLQDSLQEVGAARSIVIDENNVVLAGNATVEAAGIAGIERVQIVDADGETIIAVRRSNLTAAQKTRLALFDNRTAELAEWNEDVLEELSGSGFDLSNLWHEDELAALLAEVTQTDGGLLDDADPDAIPDASEVETRVKAGEVWACGPHRVACIDSADPGAVALFLNGVTFPVVFTDPPYGMHKDFANDGDEWAVVVHQALEVCPVGAWVYAFCASTPRLWRQSWDIVRPDRIIIWQKPWNLAPPVHGIAWHYEPILVRAGEAPHQGNIGDVLTHPCIWRKDDPESVSHPTQKPVSLCAEILSSAPSGNVYDPFLGSGTTIIAAEKTGRVVYGCELSAEYCSIVLERYERATGKTATLLENVNGPSD